MSTSSARTPLGFVTDHPLVAVLLTLEGVLLIGGYLLGTYAADAPRGSTGLRDVGALMGALAIVFATLAALFVLVIGAVRIMRRVG